MELPFDEIVRIELRVIVEQIRSLNKSIAELEKTIGEEGSKLEGHKGLSSIKGIGKITGAILLSVTGDVNDFADEGRLASYFGIVPRVSNSNETEHSGRIHKRGTKLGRTALVQSALIAANYSPYLKRFYGPQPQYIFAPFQIHTDRHVHGPVLHPPFVAHLHIQRVEIHDRVQRLQRPILPRLDLVGDGVGYVRDQGGAHLHPVYLFQMPLNFPCRHAPCVHRHNLVVESVEPRLVLLQQLRLKARVPSLGASMVSSPNSPFTVFGLVPFREFPLLWPAGLCFSYPS